MSNSRDNISAKFDPAPALVSLPTSMNISKRSTSSHWRLMHQIHLKSKVILHQSLINVLTLATIHTSIAPQLAEMSPDYLQSSSSSRVQFRKDGRSDKPIDAIFISYWCTQVVWHVVNARSATNIKSNLSFWSSTETSRSNATAGQIFVNDVKSLAWVVTGKVWTISISLLRKTNIPRLVPQCRGNHDTEQSWVDTSWLQKDPYFCSVRDMPQEEAQVWFPASFLFILCSPEPHLSVRDR